jgi:hypothetical protein
MPPFIVHRNAWFGWPVSELYPTTTLPSPLTPRGRASPFPAKEFSAVKLNIASAASTGAGSMSIGKHQASDRILFNISNLSSNRLSPINGARA